MKHPPPQRWTRAREQTRCLLGAVTQAGTQAKSEPWSGFGSNFRIFGSFACVLLVEGTGRFEDDRGLNVELAAGDLWLIYPDVGHRYGPGPGAKWQEIYLVFDGPVFDRWYAEGLLRADRPVFHTHAPERWERRLRETLEPDALGSEDALVEVCRVQQMLADLIRDTTKDSRRIHPWARQASALIDATIPGEPDWDAVAASLHSSPATLRRRFADHFGLSPSLYRTHRMIDRACDLMHRTDLTDQQIASQLGFCDPFYFSRRFKQIMGQSPREYRQSLL